MWYNNKNLRFFRSGVREKRKKEDKKVNEQEEWLKNFFENDKFVQLAGIEVVEVTNERAVVAADIEEKHLNGNGCVQGGMIYTLADFAFAVLGNHLHPMTVTQGGHITYLRPAYTSKLTATAIETERAGHTSICEVVVRDDKDKIVCVCNFNGFVKDITKEEMAEIVRKGRER